VRACVRACVCVCVGGGEGARSEWLGSHDGTQRDLVACLQRRTEADGTLTVRQRETGAVADTVSCTAVDLLGASCEEPLKMELNYMSVITNVLWSEPWM
jgi:hypothetical protein